MTNTTQEAQAVQQQNMQEPDFSAPVPTAQEQGVQLADNSVRDQFMQAMTPRDFDDVWRMSDMIANSDLAPKDYKGKPGNVMIAWQTGVELGITSPMQAIQNIAVINGRPTIWGDMMLAICRAAPAWSEADFAEWIEGEGAEAVANCTVRRRPNGNVVHYTFSMKDAQDASLAGKQGPWQQYPKRMMQMRARSFALRDTFTPELKGIRMAEEERDITPEAQAGAQPAQRAQASQQQRGTAGRVGGKLSQRRQQQAERQQAQQVYETTAQEAPAPGGEITAEYVCGLIQQSTNDDDLADAADMARHLPEADQQAARDAYRARLDEMKASQQ